MEMGTGTILSMAYGKVLSCSNSLSRFTYLLHRFVEYLAVEVQADLVDGATQVLVCGGRPVLPCLRKQGVFSYPQI